MGVLFECVHGDLDFILFYCYYLFHICQISITRQTVIHLCLLVLKFSEETKLVHKSEDI